MLAERHDISDLLRFAGGVMLPGDVIILGVILLL